MNVITQVVLPLSLAFIMFSMGLALVTGDFKRVFTEPKAFLIGATAQVILLPLITFGLVSLWGLTSALAVGVVIIAACPGGVTSNLMTHLAKGDTALSISLTAVISILSLLTIPFIVNAGLTHFMSADEAVTLPLGKTVAGIFLVTTVPVAIGMFINAKFQTVASRFEPMARKIASFLFVLVVIGAVLKDRANLVAYFQQAGPITFILNITMMGMGFQLARFFRLDKRQAIAISLEAGLQNGAMAIFIAATILKNPVMMIPGAIYSLIMFFTAGLFIFLINRGGSFVGTGVPGRERELPTQRAA